VDVKRLVRVDENRLEQWVPIVKAPFPLSAADTAIVLEAVGVTGAGDAADTLSKLAGASSQLRAVAVHKRRVHFTFACCMAGLRVAPNGAELVPAVRARCSVEIEFLAGDEEARLAYVAATAELGPTAGTRVVFDTGGGSSQFTFGDGVAERFSLDVGAVRFTERYRLTEPTARARLGELHAAIAAELEWLDGRPAPAAIIGLQPNRAEVILAGACIVPAVLALLGRDALTVSDRGLRHGLLSERFALGAPVPAALTATATL
jgi:hypothetical protein